MAYLVYYSHSNIQIIHDEKMEEYKQSRLQPPVLARFPLTEAEARLTIDELKQIYPLIIRKAYDPRETEDRSRRAR
jgi:hypothetical protein